jgi:hypothetical protein
METMFADQYVTKLLIDALKAMEALIAEQKNHIQQLENQRDLFRAGYIEAVARCREIDPSWRSSLNDGPTAPGTADDSDPPTSRRP